MVVAHVSKYSGSNFSSGALGRHIDREHIPENARAEDQAQNFELVPSSQSLKEDIEKRIEQGYKGNKAIRKDAVKSCGVIFSGSNEQMKKIESADLIGDWAKDTYGFACDRWGKENIVRASVHMDEKTPHMHLHFVPLLGDGRLSAKEIVSKINLKSLQNDYAILMQEYGLERGIEGSKQRHTTTKQYYKKLNETKENAEMIIAHPEAKELIKNLLQENQELKREKELKEANEQGKKEGLKNNPDKANHYEIIGRKNEREQGEQSRRSPEIKNRDGGISF